MKNIILVGTYSDFGLHKLSFENGILTPIVSNNHFANCSYLCKHNDTIFNVVEGSNFENSFIIARNYNLSTINAFNVNGISPCYIHLDKSRNLLYLANYSDGSLNVFSLNPDDSLQKLIFSMKFTNHSHIHCIELSLDGDFLFITDLGDNKLFAYQIIFDKNSFDLKYTSQYSFPNDANPRHLVVNANDIFLITEASCELYHFSFSKTSGFKFLEKLSLLPDAKANLDTYTGCAIKFSENKEFIYTSIRGLDEICVFSVTPNLEFKQRISCYGKTPRDLFIIDDYLLCANQSSNSISIFDINKNTGNLCYKNLFNIDSPAYIINL